MTQRALIIKGFTWGIDMSNPTHSEAARSVVEMAENYDIIAWDGDKHKPGSFTQVINEIIQTYPDKKYKAFRIRGTVKNLEFGNKPDVLELNVNKNNFVGLGQKAFERLKETNKLNVDVVFLGVGDVAGLERAWLETVKKIEPRVFDLQRNRPKIE